MKNTSIRCSRLSFVFCFSLLTAVWLPAAFTDSVCAEPGDGLLDDESDISALIADLPQQFDLENAGVADFKSLPMFTTAQAESVVAFRAMLPPGESLAGHVASVEGLPPLQQALLEYLATSVPGREAVSAGGAARFGIVYAPQDYNLKQSKYYTRLSVQQNETVSFHALMERDRREPRALDLLAASVRLDSFGGRLTTILGDFRTGYGRGLLLSRYGFGYGNGTGVTDDPSARLVNTTFEETKFMRGSHLTLTLDRLTTAVWISSRRLDATCDEQGRAVTIRDSGIHEAGDVRRNLEERIYGTRITVALAPNARGSITRMRSEYDPSLARRDGERYYYNPAGGTFGHTAYEMDYSRGPVEFAGEYVRMDNGESAVLGAVRFDRDDIAAGVSARSYSEGYWALRSGSTESFGSVRNEKGIYASVEARLSETVQSLVSLDLAKTVGRTYVADMPVERRRLYGMVEKTFPHAVAARMQGRAVNDNGGLTRWSSDVRVGDSGAGDYDWFVRSGISAGREDAGPVAGGMFRIHRDDARLTVVADIFDIPSYDARWYRYEYSVPGRGFFTPLWGRGMAAGAVYTAGYVSIAYSWSDSDLMTGEGVWTAQIDRTW